MPKVPTKPTLPNFDGQFLNFAMVELATVTYQTCPDTFMEGGGHGGHPGIVRLARDDAIRTPLPSKSHELSGDAALELEGRDNALAEALALVKKRTASLAFLLARDGALGGSKTVHVLFHVVCFLQVCGWVRAANQSCACSGGHRRWPGLAGWAPATAVWLTTQPFLCLGVGGGLPGFWRLSTPALGRGCTLPAPLAAPSPH